MQITGPFQAGQSGHVVIRDEQVNGGVSWRKMITVRTVADDQYLRAVVQSTLKSAKDYLVLRAAEYLDPCWEATQHDTDWRCS